MWRYGDEWPPPSSTGAEADYIVSFELLEADAVALLPAGWRHHRHGTPSRWSPCPSSPARRSTRPGLGKMRARGAKVDAFDALAAATEAGSSKAVNIALMGRLSNYFDFPESAWEEALEKSVPAKFLELNKKAFRLGKNS